MLPAVLCVDKPRGVTSHDVVDAVRRFAGIRAVGHTGTLDPDATGLLLLCLGRATKFARFFEGLEKTYWTVMRVGVCTDTQDATGRILRVCPVPPLSLCQVEGVLRQFTGLVSQLPPMYSAVRHQGQRLHQLARRGQVVARQARDVDIKRLQLLDLRGTAMTLSVACSKGTYVRTLCEDLGLALGYGAHMVHLQRCRVGPFSLQQAYTVPFLEAQAKRGTFANTLMPLAEALDFLPALALTLPQKQALRSGQGRVLPSLLEALPTSSENPAGYRLWTPPDGTFAILHRHGSTPEKWKLSYLETLSSTAKGRSLNGWSGLARARCG